MEWERRIGEGLPLKDDCYFARLASGMSVREEDLFGLFVDFRIAVHLKGGSATMSSSTDWEPDPKDYHLHEREMVMALSRLRENGGYVWLEYEHSNKATVGVVTPGTGIEARKVRRAPKKYGKKGLDADTEITLLTMRLTKVRGLQPGEEIALRASRPLVPNHVNRSLVSWRPACGASALVSFFDGRGEENLEARWNDLPVALRATACVEFLRHHEKPGLPRLKHLLLPLTTLSRDVDIYGVAEDGTEILAQVPFQTNREKEGFEARVKAERLRNYEGSGAKLVCFVPGFGGGDEKPDQEQKLFEDRSPNVDDEVIFVPVEEVLKWFEKNPGYAEKVFFA